MILLSSSIFHLTVPRYVAFALLAIPLTFHVIAVGFVMKSHKSLVMEADAPSSNMRGCESESKVILCSLFLKCVDIVFILQHPFDSHVLWCHLCILFHVFHLWYCFHLHFALVLIHLSRHMRTELIRWLVTHFTSKPRSSCY